MPVAFFDVGLDGTDSVWASFNQRRIGEPKALRVSIDQRETRQPHQFLYLSGVRLMMFEEAYAPPFSVGALANAVGIPRGGSYTGIRRTRRYSRAKAVLDMAK